MSRRTLTVLAITAAAVAGCGGSSKKSSTASTAATSAPPAGPVAKAPGGKAKAYKLAAKLSVGAEVPKARGARRAAGAFSGSVTLKGSAARLTWRLSFSRLSGNALAAHIHLGRPGKPGPIAIPLCAPCKSPANGSFSGKIPSALLRGGTYVNVHTKKNPNGEIRGQLAAKASKR